MSRPSNLPEPWLSLANRLGGAGRVYAALHDRLGLPERTAKRVCRGGALSLSEWLAIEALFREHGLTLMSRQ